MTHMYVGSYVLDAVMVGLSQILTPMFCKGKHSHAEYIEEPIRIFPKTKEEIAAEKEEMTKRFIEWGNMLTKQYEKPD